MLRALILRRLDAEERSLGESIEYTRHIVRSSLPAFLRFALCLPLARHRRALPAVPYHVARIVATRDEDCGTCVQIEVNEARRAGVPAEVVRAVVEQRLDALPPEAADAYRFAAAVVRATGEEGAPRERLRQRFGEEALVELALAIAAARVFPIVKRALGYATSCSRVALRT
jgi:alkylhydroperoxidase family enzyme